MALLAGRCDRSTSVEPTLLRYEVSYYFLATYHPIGLKKRVRELALQKGIPPFVDGSCRREPDFEHRYPSITSLCRGLRFARRLHLDDYVVYLTVQGTYPPKRDVHWRLVAVLRVREILSDHALAAAWYARQGLRLPYNCIVPGNRPLPLVMTDRSWSSVHDWDVRYRKRAKDSGVFAVCDPVYCELDEPPIVTRKDFTQVFDGIPATLTPPRIERRQFHDLCKIAGVRIK